MFRFLSALFLALTPASRLVVGFSVKPSLQSFPRPSTAQYVVDPTTVIEYSSSLTLAEESWRQYVPLAVSVGVIGDILLGSPLANMVLKPMRPDQEKLEGETQKRGINRSKERIDTEKIAQAALDKAESTLELRRFLDEQKSDWDRMEDMKKKLDSEMQDLDEDLQAREESLAKRRESGE